ncbi:Acg family FMN-binding oxidoreductase [Sphingomonas mesophila]|uniref:Acg family FMN-binding oxidoreductase n=1 Tax=Sphingomonas mesophila TaxID=2303576 RepID=UPI000E579F1D|nr:nitroreductase [Sphingomonas mesophila]
MVDADSAWQIDPQAYPAKGTAQERLRFLLRYAVLAPSSHNSQPWRFRLAGDTLEVRADRSRRLPAVDPDDRALTISCGAAIGMLVTAMRRFGNSGTLALLPEPREGDLMARVTLGAPRAPDQADEARCDAITRRRTTRRALSGTLPGGLAERLSEIAEAAGVELAIIAEAERREVIGELIAQGDRAQFADPAFRRELGHWVRSRRSRRGDGMSGANFGLPDRLSRAGGLVVRLVDMGKGIAAKDRTLAAQAPALLAIATPGDTARDWLVAGITHAELLLEVTAAGLTAAYMNQPIEVPALRPRLRHSAGLRGIPQLLLRIGSGPTVPPAARRPLEAVLE